MGIGLGLMISPLFDFVLASVTDAEVGSASGVLNAGPQLGGASASPALARCSSPRSVAGDRRLVYGGQVSFEMEGIDHVALAVGDQSASESWYREVLGLTRAFEEEWGDTPVVMTSQSGGMALFKASDAGGTGPLVRHLAFRVDRANFEAAQRDLRDRGIDFEFQDHGAAHSIYFTDPDGFRLELTTYDV